MRGTALALSAVTKSNYHSFFSFFFSFACFSSMTARHRHAAKLLKLCSEITSRGEEVKKDLRFLCWFLCCVSDWWGDRVPAKITFRATFFIRRPFWQKKKKNLPHVFCWIPAVFLSHFFLAQPWHCVALEYIYNRRQKAAKLRKKKKDILTSELIAIAVNF